MVDAAEGVLGIEWIDGQSVRYLLGDDEEEDMDDGIEGTEHVQDASSTIEESLSLYGLSQCEPVISLFALQLLIAVESRGHGAYRRGACEDACRRYNTWRSHDVKHDVAAAFVGARA